MPRSLLDGADLPRLRSLVGDDPAMAAAVGLVDSGLLQFDPDDPGWGDRDRLVVAGTRAWSAARERLVPAGADPTQVATAAGSGGEAMALAFGAAAAARMDGNVWRVWCLLDAEACDDGRIWEVARAAVTAATEALVVVAEESGVTGLWRACGWTVHPAPAADPAWLLGALDQAVVAAPAAVVIAHA
jgi:hypothetical protein